MTPASKRFIQRYRPIYDAVASARLDQEDREALARDLADRIAKGTVPGRGEAKPDPDFRADLFVALASDPLVPCAGFHDDDGEVVACPNGRVIRIPMHNSDAPDGRSAEWKPRPSEMRCVSCGAIEFIPDYRKNALARRAS